YKNNLWRLNKIFYELIGQYKINENSSFLLNKNTQKKYEIYGENVSLFNEFLQYLTGTNSLEAISKELAVNKKDLIEIINQLNELGLLKENKQYNLKLLIVSDEFKQSKSLQKTIYDNNLPFEKVIINNHKNMEKNIKIGHPTLILCINSFYNKTSIKRIEKIAIEKGVYFLNVSLFGNSNFVGPLFSIEDGPCSECLDRTNVIKNYDFNEPLGHIHNSLSDIITHEIIRFIKDTTYVNTFNTVFNVNLSELTVKKIGF